MARCKVSSSLCIVLLVVYYYRAVLCSSYENEYVSAIGDPYMKRDGLRLAIESWNQCNEVGEETANMGSPRAADCFDIYKATQQGKNNKCSLCNSMPYMLVHRVTEKDNRLGVGQPFQGITDEALNNIDLYASEKELYLGNKCQVEDSPKPWQFWMIMLKSGNMDTLAAKCPNNGHKADPFPPNGQFPCFGKGCMNQPLIYHNYTSFKEVNGSKLEGRFYGSWDLDADLSKGTLGNDVSYHSVTWEKNLGQGSWVFHHVLRTSSKYPWLMLYLRADATKGFSGGYHYSSRGMLKTIPESPNFNVTFTLNVIKGGGPSSQFYLMDIGSCWKNNGDPCDGDVTSDVTRYSEMIINPQTSSWCGPNDVKLCPPYHTFPNRTRVHRNDTYRFPYEAYHLYCGPGNAGHMEKPGVGCDPYSNPQPQEILQILPHPVWGEYGYPTKKGDGWVGDQRTWNLDVGGLSQSLYFYQDPGTEPVKRRWMSIDLGTEIYKDANQEAEWTVSDFNILVPNKYGDPTEQFKCSLENAEAYNGGLVREYESGRGTPLMPHKKLEIYLFALFNEDQKNGPLSEKNFGLFRPDFSPIYDVGLLRTKDAASPVEPAPRPVSSSAPAQDDKKWCLPKPDASESALQGNLDYVCSQGGVNCQPIQPGGPCFDPNTVRAHASFVMNAYYQTNGQHDFDCYFDGTGVVSYSDPSTAACKYVA